MWKINSDNQLVEFGDKKIGDIVWVSSGKAVFYRAELPLNQRHIWAQTVGFVLEDKLIDAVETLHFAIGAPDDQEDVPVVTLPIQDMETWLGLFKEKRIKAKSIWLDFLAVPFEREDGYDAVLWHEQGRCILRLGEQECITGTLEWIFSLIKIKSPTDKIRIYSDDISSLPQEWREETEALPCSLEERMIQFGRKNLLLNLMQGSICPESPMMTWLKPWYGTVVTLFLLLGIYLVGLGFETRSLNAQTDLLKRATEKTFLDNFPGGGKAVDVRLQVSRILAQASGGGGQQSGSLWKLIKKVDPILSGCQPCQVENIKLRSASVLMIVSSSEDLNKVTNQIKGLPDISVSVEKMEDKNKRKQIRVELKTQEPA